MDEGGSAVFEDLRSTIEPWREPETDEEKDPKLVEKWWDQLLELPSCQQILLQESHQKNLQLVIGVNVSQEFPWKQIRYKYLRDHLFDHVENSGELYENFSGYEPDMHILIGYAPLITQNVEEPPPGDPFIMFANPSDAKTALLIIRNIEKYERWRIQKRLVKKPKQWVSHESEKEVNVFLEQTFEAGAKVEVQSAYPVALLGKEKLVLRKSHDARDGYVELLPLDTKIDNIIRRRVHVGLQIGESRMNLEQQTEPTFPSNNWSQYLYEIDENEQAYDSSTDEERDSHHTKAKIEESGEGTLLLGQIELSENIQFLLKTLDFNRIDMYRNDYPQISSKQIEHYVNPYLEETLCFADISKSHDRFVCGVDWYPALSGLLVTSYTYSTPVTFNIANDKIDIVQRVVLQPNPILMWSFSDNLNSKLEFESPLEVTSLSFCPYIPDILLGGAKNGQLFIWDLQNRVKNLEQHEVLSAAQLWYRAMIADFLKWTIMSDEVSKVPPATITPLESSQSASITGIYWMSQDFYISNYGKIHKEFDARKRHKFFFTCASDGSLTFWNLDVAAEKKVAGGTSSQKNQPKSLSQNESSFKNKVLKPIFTIVFNEPIISVVSERPIYSCVVREKANVMDKNYPISMVPTTPPLMKQTLVVASLYGHIDRINWIGSYSEADGREHVVSSINYARVHDGPIVSLKTNPFYPQLMAAVGRNILSVWRENFHSSPIFWRRRPCDLTAIIWSENRPAVFFITRIDGCMESWDILSRDDDACLSDIIGGGIITAISEHKPIKPDKLLGMGDYNSSFRMIKLPSAFFSEIPHEMKKLEDYVTKEEHRKKSIQTWENKFIELNHEFMEAKYESENEARKEMERLEKEQALLEARKALEEAEKAKESSQIGHIPYPERMRREWEKINLNRMLEILMIRKHVNAQELERDTALEKERLKFEEAKKECMSRIFSRIGEEVAEIRARILPVERPDMLRDHVINRSATEYLQYAFLYDHVEKEAFGIINVISEFKVIDRIEFLKRGEERRKFISKSLGGNTERLHWKALIKSDIMHDEYLFDAESYFSNKVMSA